MEDNLSARQTKRNDDESFSSYLHLIREFFLSFWVHKEKDQKLFLPSILKRCFMDNLPLFIIINPGLAGIRIEIYWPKANFSNFDLKTNRVSVHNQNN